LFNLFETKKHHIFSSLLRSLTSLLRRSLKKTHLNPLNFHFPDKYHLYPSFTSLNFSTLHPRVIIFLPDANSYLTGVACLLPRSSLQYRWGVVQLVGHLTVNEDGEGSNPSAPANFFQQ
jgi:hypothetical protein